MEQDPPARSSAGTGHTHEAQKPFGGNAEQTHVRWAFLAEASRCLSDSLDYETTLETVAGLALPLLGSWSIVDVTEPDESVRRLAIVHPDPEKQVIACELRNGWPPKRGDPIGVAAVVRTGRSEMQTEITDAFLVSVGRNDENLGRLRDLGMTSVMTVPMKARGRILGAITFIASAEGRPFTKADLSLAESLADRCGLAVDNARLHRSARALAHAERARISAEAANQAKSDFLRTVSHELRTPLNVMAGYLELLAMEIAGPLTARQRQYIERVQSSEQQLLQIVEDMLNFVRAYAGEVDYTLADVALSTVAEDLVETYRQGFEDKGLEFVVRCDADVRAHTDSAKAWQIMMNLLSNARKFTDPGGKVTLECAMDENRPTIRVTDSGWGIPEDKLSAVFEPFVQADTSLTRAAEGVGLGLSISRQLARDLGGDLTVSSKLGVGSTFTLTLAAPLDG